MGLPAAYARCMRPWVRLPPPSNREAVGMALLGWSPEHGASQVVGAARAFAQGDGWQGGVRVRGLPMQGEPWLVEAAQVAVAGPSNAWRLQAGTLQLSFGEGVLLRTIAHRPALGSTLHPPRPPRPHLTSLRARAPALVGVAGQLNIALGRPGAVCLTPFWAYVPGAPHDPYLGGALVALQPQANMELGLLMLQGGQVAATGRLQAPRATLHMELARLPEGHLLWRGRLATLGVGRWGLALSSSALGLFRAPYAPSAPAGKRVGLVLSWQTPRARAAWHLTWHRPPSRRLRLAYDAAVLHTRWRYALHPRMVLHTHFGARQAWHHPTAEHVKMGFGVLAQLTGAISSSIAGRTQCHMRKQAWRTFLQVQGRAQWRRLLALRLRATHTFGASRPTAWRLALAAEAPFEKLGFAVGAGWQWEASGPKARDLRLQAYLHATL